MIIKRRDILLWNSLFKDLSPEQDDSTADREKNQFLIAPRPKTEKKQKQNRLVGQNPKKKQKLIQPSRKGSWL